MVKGVKAIESIPRFWSLEEISPGAVVEAPVPVQAQAPVKGEDSGRPEPKRHLDPDNPLADFQAMIAEKHEDLVESALLQLMALIPRYVRGGQDQLALDCFVALRRAAVQVGDK